MALTLIVVWQFGPTWLGLAACAFTWTLIALAFIDFDTQLLPDQMTVPLAWAGLLVNLALGEHAIVGVGAALIGAVAGYLSLWSIYWAFKLITGREGMGYGDFKLFAATGAWLGWQVLPMAILIAAASGLLFALISGILGRRESGPIPFGPFIAVGAFVCLVLRDTVLGVLFGA